MSNFNSSQKVQDFRFLNGTIHHVLVDEVVWCNPLRRNQEIDLHKQELKTVPE